MNIFLFSKLLKEHESKYEPLGHDETFKIMEEILAMQIGINTEQVSLDVHISKISYFLHWKVDWRPFFHEGIRRRKTTCTFPSESSWGTSGADLSRKKPFHLELISYQLMHRLNHKHFMGEILKAAQRSFTPTGHLGSSATAWILNFILPMVPVSWCVRVCVCDACLCLYVPVS